jgi:glycosyltransferase involved in cell wall biosynthesis
MIVSGVNPWISASIAVLGKILRKKVVMDFHGFAWLEANITNATRLPTKVLLLVSEKISYRLSQYIITASEWLASILAYHFSNRKDVIVIENAVSYVFEKVACKLMENYDSSMLRKYICEKVLHRGDCFDKLLFIAPLPSVFKSNMLAYEELLKLTPSLNENAIVAVTGVKRTDVFESQGNIIPIGYVNYVNYIALLLSSDGVILPYPSNAICGGIRNKVLEAGFCRKLVISTKIGVMHAKVAPNIHYIAIDNEIALQGLKEETQNIAKNLSNLIKEKYSFATFKKALLKLLTLMV